MSPKPILSQVDELLSTLKDLMPTIYQKETLESILGLLLDGQGNAVPHHCQTKSESAISRFLNHYNWSTRSLIRTIRSFILNLVLSQRKKGRKPILQVIIDLTTEMLNLETKLYINGQMLPMLTQIHQLRLNCLNQ